MVKRNAISMMLVVVSVALAGCASESAPEPVENVDKESFVHKEGKGAIAGLLVDDRFRPIQLTDDPETEFQTTGFILLQETGQQVQTTENGEFSFVDLDPGSYTLRVTAAGHEAVPTKVGVAEGAFSELSVVARRVASEGSTILTEEYSAFSPCFINFVAFSYTADCTGDRSGETFRAGIRGRNLSSFEDLTWVVAETQFNQVPSGGAAYDVVIRRDIDTDYTADVLWDRSYSILHLINGDLTPDPEVPGVPFEVWTKEDTFEMLMFGRGYGAEEVRTTYAPVRGVLQQGPCIPGVIIECVQDIPMRRGAGGTMGNKAQMMLSIFLGEPEVDPMEYCVLC